MITALLEKNRNQSTGNVEFYKLDFNGENTQLVARLRYLVAITAIGDYEVAEELNNFYNKKINQLKNCYKNVSLQIKQLKKQHIMPVIFYKQNYKKVKQLNNILEEILDCYDELESRKKDPFKCTLDVFSCGMAYVTILEKFNFDCKKSKTLKNKEFEAYAFDGDENLLLEIVNDEINLVKREHQRKKQFELKWAKNFTRNCNIDNLIKQHSPQQENQLEK